LCISVSLSCFISVEIMIGHYLFLNFLSTLGLQFCHSWCQQLSASFWNAILCSLSSLVICKTTVKIASRMVYLAITRSCSGPNQVLAGAWLGPTQSSGSDFVYFISVSLSCLVPVEIMIGYFCFFLKK
jgi:hypothetical protein